MPTSPKLIAAVILGITGWLCAELLKPLMEESHDVSNLSPIFAVIGVVVGWKYLGPRADRRMGSYSANAITTALVQIFLTLFLFSGTEMVNESLRKAYDGPVEAMQDIFVIGLEYVLEYFNGEVIAVVFLGGFIAAWSADRAAKKWG